MFNVGGVKFEILTFNFQQCAKKYKALAPGGSVFNTTLPSMNIKDAEEKMAARKALSQPGGAMAKKLKVAEKMIADLKTEYCCGDQSTLADFYLFNFLGFICSGFLDGITVDFLESYEKMSALRSQVASIPKVKALYGTTKGFDP